LQKEIAGLHPDFPGDKLGVLEARSSLANRYNVVLAGEWEKISESPDTGKVQFAALGGPAMLEVFKAQRDGDTVPVIANVEEPAAISTRK
jgi:hypothetical protein